MASFDWQEVLAEREVASGKVAEKAAFSQSGKPSLAMGVSLNGRRPSGQALPPTRETQSPANLLRIPFKVLIEGSLKAKTSACYGAMEPALKEQLGTPGPLLLINSASQFKDHPSLLERNLPFRMRDT